MSGEIDTARIRRIARQVRSIAGNVSDIAQRELAAARSNMDGNFEGAAANALTEALNELAADVNNVNSGLNSIYQALLAYAASVEEADREAARAIESN